MIHVSDADRKYPLTQVPYLDIGLDDLFDYLLTVRRANCPDWTDESMADFGTMVQWIFAVLSKWMTAHIERAAGESFIGTATARQSMRRLCELLAGYQLGEGTPASVTVTFTCEAGHPEFTIPAGTQVSTKETRTQPGIIFETAAAQLVTVGTSAVAVVCTQGETISDEVLGSSDGSTDQSFKLSRNAGIRHSETVDVFDGYEWVEWDRVNNFVLSDADDADYRVENDDDGTYWIIFGDGIRGRIPPRGVNNVRVTYRIGGGASGNVGVGVITELLSSVTYVESVTNAAAAAGGSDKETLEHARLFAPASIRTLDRGVTLEDYETLCREYLSATFGGIANAKAYSIGGMLVRVMIVPEAGGYPASGLKSELQAYLEPRRSACMGVTVIDPTYKLIDIDADVVALSNYSPSQIAAGIRDRIMAHLSPTYQDQETGLYPHGFGRNVNLSDLYEIIDGTTGVDHCTINAPTANIIVLDYEIADVGEISIDVTTPTGESSHFELGK